MSRSRTMMLAVAAAAIRSRLAAMVPMEGAVPSSSRASQCEARNRAADPQLVEPLCTTIEPKFEIVTTPYFAPPQSSCPQIVSCTPTGLVFAVQVRRVRCKHGESEGWLSTKEANGEEVLRRVGVE